MIGALPEWAVASITILVLMLMLGQVGPPDGMP